MSAKSVFFLWLTDKSSISLVFYLCLLLLKTMFFFEVSLAEKNYAGVIKGVFWEQEEVVTWVAHFSLLVEAVISFTGHKITLVH